LRDFSSVRPFDNTSPPCPSFFRNGPPFSYAHTFVSHPSCSGRFRQTTDPHKQVLRGIAASTTFPSFPSLSQGTRNGSAIDLWVDFSSWHPGITTRSALYRPSFSPSGVCTFSPFLPLREWALPALRKVFAAELNCSFPIGKTIVQGFFFSDVRLQSSPLPPTSPDSSHFFSDRPFLAPTLRRKTLKPSPPWSAYPLNLFWQAVVNGRELPILLVFFTEC